MPVGRGPVAHRVAGYLLHRGLGVEDRMRQDAHGDAVAPGPEVPGGLPGPARLPGGAPRGPGPRRPPGGAAAAPLVEEPEREFRPGEGLPPGLAVPGPAASDRQRELGVVAVLAACDLFVVRPETGAATPGPSGELHRRLRQGTGRPHPPGHFLRPPEGVPGRQRQEPAPRPRLHPRQPHRGHTRLDRHASLPASQGRSSGFRPARSSPVSRYESSYSGTNHTRGAPGALRHSAATRLFGPVRPGGVARRGSRKVGHRDPGRRRPLCRSVRRSRCRSPGC